MNKTTDTFWKSMLRLGFALGLAGLSFFGWRVAASHTDQHLASAGRAIKYRLEYTATGAPRLMRAASPAAPLAQTDIVGPPGSGAFGTLVMVLPNGNIIVTDPAFSLTSPSPVAAVGAVYLINGADLSIISTLTGSVADDQVGSGGVSVLTNGNFVVRSPLWNNGAAADAGAVTWCSGTTGCDGAVSPANSLVGGSANDSVGQQGVAILTNGNYVVISTAWDNPSPTAANAGAVTWGNGLGGTVGLVSATNSLVGGRANDNVGSTGVIQLTNSNYVVASPFWDNPSPLRLDAGAATWGNGLGGTAGLVSAANSIVGTSTSDQVALNSVVPLTNGNYVVRSAVWDEASPFLENAGAATWGNGNGGTVGVISAANSLIGGRAGDLIGSFGVTALSNGNYVVLSPVWDNPSPVISNVGAATWGNGATGTVGVVSAANSLIGGSANDFVPISVTALTNGNYVVRSHSWDNPSPLMVDVGAVTWCNGASPTVGVVTADNSLIGGSPNDQIGNYGVAPLTNGNYVVVSGDWDNPASAMADVGAVTWGDGAKATTGVVTAANSLIGGMAGDQVGSGFVTVLTNGNYVVSSPDWNNPASGALKAGAATWGNGATGAVGVVAASNSLIGSSMDDQVSSGGLVALTNGNYVVSSPLWNNLAPATADAGAVTWANGLSGTTGVISAGNSLLGGTEGDRVGDANLLALPNGDYAVQSNNWDNPAGPIMNARAATFGNGKGGTVGLINSINSVLGTVTNGISNFSFDAMRNRLAVGRGASNLVTLLGCSFCIKTKGDFDGDGKTDLAVWRGNLFPAPWRILSSLDGSLQSIDWGTAQTPVNDEIVPGDYDGDGKTDVAVFRRSNGHWYIQRSSDGGTTDEFWGLGTDEPVPGDYDGDGKTDVAVFRASANSWYIKQSSDGMTRSVVWGTVGDTPVPGDYDGDGKTDVAVWRGSVGGWYIRQSSDGMTKSETWGTSNAPFNDVPVPADYDGDGKLDVAVWRGAMTNWYILKSSDGQTQTVSWGTSAAPYFDVPVPGDYDGDGKADVAVWRPLDGNWLVIRSFDGTNLIQQHGQSGDTPVPSKGAH